MSNEQHRWAVVLAAGAGTRLSTLTTDGLGGYTPKQFCTLDGSVTLLEETVARARALTPEARLLVVVAAEHRRWWRPLLRELPARNVIEQPLNRGTANGILLSALHVIKRDPAAIVTFLPSDHFVRDEQVLLRALQEGLRHAESDPNSIMLLGITPEEADPGLGYIVPGTALNPGVHSVQRFVEKPARGLAEALIDEGSLWNSFLFIAGAKILLSLFARRQPATLESVRLALLREDWSHCNNALLKSVYEAIPATDFSKHLLEGAEAMLRLLPVPRCGWTDLGTPERVGRCLERLGARLLRGRTSVQERESPCLAQAYERMCAAV